MYSTSEYSCVDVACVLGWLIYVYVCIYIYACIYIYNALLVEIKIIYKLKECHSRCVYQNYNRSMIKE